MSANIDYSLGVPAFAMIEGSTRPWWSDEQQIIPQFPINSQWATVLEQSKIHKTTQLVPACVNGVEVPGYFGVVRQDNQNPLSIVQGRYRPLDNENLSFLDDLLGFGLQYETAMGLDSGRITVVTMKLPDDLRIIGDDIVKQYLFATNTFDGSMRFRIDKANTRVVCQNTHRMALREGSSIIQAKHTDSLELKLKKLPELFEEVKRQSTQYLQDCQLLACKTVSDEQIEAFLYDVLGYGKEFALVKSGQANLKESISTRARNQVEKISELAFTGMGTDIPGVKGSLWGLYNAVSEYTDHEMTPKGKSLDKMLVSTYFGSGASLKDKAFNKALELAKN